MNYVEYLRTISQHAPEFAAETIVAQEIDAELPHIRQGSHHGFYHARVKAKGYPLPRDLLASAPYCPRPNLESRLQQSVEQGRNTILLGCEGSGKTTLIHRVIGGIADGYKGMFIYSDVSDVDVQNEPNYAETIYRKLVTAINLSVSPDVSRGFTEWHGQQSAKNNILVTPLLNINTPKTLAEVFFFYLRTRDSTAPTYLILDNIDSLSIAAAKALFSVLSLAEENVRAIARGLNLVDNGAVRYILACRTPTFSHVTNYSQGLFLHFLYELIQVDDDFLTKTNVLDLLRTSVLGSSELARSAPTNIEVPLFPGCTTSAAFAKYAQDIFDWLEPNTQTFDKTIKMFCGRSIRRAKLFGLKVLASPVVAKLAYMEKYKSVDVTFTDKNYLKRRLQERC